MHTCTQVSITRDGAIRAKLLDIPADANDFDAVWVEGVGLHVVSFRENARA